MKLILGILIALSLIGSPGAAIAAPSASCTMAGAGAGSAVDHEKMDCCSLECATPCPSAVLPMSDVGEDGAELVTIAAWQTAPGSLPSVLLPADDPPPRNFSA